MVLSGGVGVVAVVVFVAAVALGAEMADPPPGARLGLTAAEGPAALALLVPRCHSERVTSVEVRSSDDVVLWRIRSRKGSIDERYVVGAEDPPLGFVTEVSLNGPPPTGKAPGEAVTAVVEVAGEASDTTDQVRFRPAEVPQEGVLHQGVVIGPKRFEARAAAAADCQPGGRHLGLATWLFVTAAAAVVVTYVMMVVRYLTGRSAS